MKKLIFFAGMALHVFFATAQNVGIGTTTPQAWLILYSIRSAGQQSSTADLIVFVTNDQNAIRLPITQNPGSKPYRFCKLFLNRQANWIAGPEC
jgi:hypothetical protein